MKNILLIITLLYLLFGCSETPYYEPELVGAIFIMDDDGSNVTHLIDDSPENVQFTLDDEKIIINRLGGGIWSVNIDGTNLQNLTNTPDVQEGYPYFSFDGSKIVYTTRQDSINSIYIMDTSGANKRKIISNSTKYYLYSYPIFNGDGSTIFYKHAGLPRGLYSINVDGTNNTLLYEDYIGYTFPSISADGTKIVFYASNNIFIMDGDGTNITRLAEGGSPMISPDGSKIVFDSIKIMNSDGSGPTEFADGNRPRFSHNKYNGHYKIVYRGTREINKKTNKGILS